MHLDPRRILIFRTVARAGSVSGGARALGWTQPAVSHAMKRLREAVGEELFVRTAHGMKPTPLATDRLWPRPKISHRPPTRANGSVSMISSASRKLRKVR